MLIIFYFCIEADLKFIWHFCVFFKFPRDSWEIRNRENMNISKRESIFCDQRMLLGNKKFSCALEMKIEGGEWEFKEYICFQHVLRFEWWILLIAKHTTVVFSYIHIYHTSTFITEYYHANVINFMLIQVFAEKLQIKETQTFWKYFIMLWENVYVWTFLLGNTQRLRRLEKPLKSCNLLWQWNF